MKPLLLALLLFAAPLQAATCVGADPCLACSSCIYCAWCNPPKGAAGANRSCGKLRDLTPEQEKRRLEKIGKGKR